MFLLFCLFIFSVFTPIQAQQIKKIAVFPSGISVSWTALQSVFEEEDGENKNQKKTRKKPKPKPKKLKKGELPPAPEASEPPKQTAANRLIRVVSSMTLQGGEHLALAFYDTNKKALPKYNLILTNTEKPSPAQVFFMDKAVYRDFQGILDCYFFPPKAAYFNVIVTDKRGSVINVPTNPDYDPDHLISIKEFQNLEPTKRLMFQFEVKGSAKENIMRMAIFRFR